MSHVVVVPSIYPPYTEECVASMSARLQPVMIVDNTQTNRGVAASWNLGVRRVLRERLDWLIICSAATRFGGAGGEDFLSYLSPESYASMEAVEASHPIPIAVEAAWGVGWHLIAFPRETLEHVGEFDENFWPGYWEDLDYAYRIRLTYGLEPPYWLKVDVDAYVRSFAHATRYAGVHARSPRLAHYYERKWGGPSGAETFVRPFDDPNQAVSWWPREGHPGALPRQ